MHSSRYSTTLDHKTREKSSEIDTMLDPQPIRSWLLLELSSCFWRKKVCFFSRGMLISKNLFINLLIYYLCLVFFVFLFFFAGDQFRQWSCATDLREACSEEKPRNSFENFLGQEMFELWPKLGTRIPPRVDHITSYHFVDVQRSMFFLYINAIYLHFLIIIFSF